LRSSTAHQAQAEAKRTNSEQKEKSKAKRRNLLVIFDDIIPYTRKKELIFGRSFCYLSLFCLNSQKFNPFLAFGNYQRCDTSTSRGADL
jgi:hypothetical protein